MQMNSLFHLKLTLGRKQPLLNKMETQILLTYGGLPPPTTKGQNGSNLEKIHKMSAGLSLACGI